MAAKSETERYNEIVSAVKAEFAGKTHTGDEASAEIRKRWDKAKAADKK